MTCGFSCRLLGLSGFARFSSSTRSGREECGMEGYSLVTQQHVNVRRGWNPSSHSRGQSEDK